MEEYKEFRGCKFKLGERVRVVPKEKMKKHEEYPNQYKYMYVVNSQSGIIVDKLSSGYILQMNDDILNDYGIFHTRRMNGQKIFGNTVKEFFLTSYSKNKRLE